MGVGGAVLFGWIWGNRWLYGNPKGGFWAVCARVLCGVWVGARLVVGGLYGNPKRFVWGVGYGALLCFGELVRLSGIWGNLGCFRARWDLERSFCVCGNLGFMLL